MPARSASKRSNGHWIPTVEHRPKSRPRPAGEDDARSAVLERLRLEEKLQAYWGQPDTAAGGQAPS